MTNKELHNNTKCNEIGFFEIFGIFILIISITIGIAYIIYDLPAIVMDPFLLSDPPINDIWNIFGVMS